MTSKSQSQLSDLQLPSSDDILKLDEVAFNELLSSLGVTFIHYRAIKCPVGITDIFDGRRPHSDHSGCSNGFLYQKAGEMTCLFSSNKMQSRLVDLGLFNEGSAILTIPTTYDDTDRPVFVFNYDRLFIKELNAQVVNTELIEYNATGVDRLQYPATFVEDLVDFSGKKYYINIDFNIDALGNIKWISGKGPGIDLQNQKGRIYSIRYLYVPFWYIQLILHELRVINGSNFITGQNQVIRKPMNILIQREYVFHNQDNQSSRMTMNTAAENFAPRNSGIFGPR